MFPHVSLQRQGASLPRLRWKSSPAPLLIVRGWPLRSKRPAEFGWLRKSQTHNKKDVPLGAYHSNHPTSIQPLTFSLGGTIHKGLVHVEANVRIEDAQQLRKLQVEPQSHPLSSNRLNFDSGQLAALMGVQATW